MPPRSQAQRRLMYAAAARKGGVDGVSQSVAKEFVAADKLGKLPERTKPMAKKVKYVDKPKGEPKTEAKAEERKDDSAKPADKGDARRAKLYDKRK